MESSRNKYLIRQAEHAAALLRKSRSTEPLIQLAETFSSLSQDARALEFYRLALRHSTVHPTQTYLSAAQVAVRSGQFEDAEKLFLRSRVLQRPSSVDNSKILTSLEAKRIAKFVEFSEIWPVDSRSAIFEPNQGTTLSGNVLPILREMMSRPECGSFDFVVVTNGGDRPFDLEEDERVIFVPRDSDAYIRHLATAKWLVTDNTFPPYFSRRDEQVYLNTWHGTPMKTLGKKIRSGRMDHRNAARNLLHTTHLASPNEFTARVLLEDNDVAHLFTGKVAITGSPRNDDTMAILKDQCAQQEVLAKLGVVGPKKTTIFYAPTWRGNLKEHAVDPDRITKTLTLLSKYPGCQVLFRGHPLDEAALADLEVESVITVPPKISTNEVLGITDLLITDYSSVAFDYAPTGRPILLYTYDLDEYTADRGFSVPPEDVTSNICHTEQELETAIETHLSRGLRSTWNPDFLKRIVEAEDGKSSKRVVDFFFGAQPSDCRILELADYKPTRRFSFIRALLCQMASLQAPAHWRLFYAMLHTE